MLFRDERVITLIVPASVIGQIKCIVEHFSTEVSWYGDIEIEDQTITITNIYLFPQVVTGGTFRTDTPQVSELYDSWYETKLNEMADNFELTGVSKPIMQYNGHSHVTAPCGASAEDMKFRKSRSGVNVYSIHNKSGGVDWEIWFDDIIYEDHDIKVIYEDQLFSKAEAYVLKPTYSTYTQKDYSGKYTTPAALPTTSVEPVASVTPEKKETINEKIEDTTWEEELEDELWRKQEEIWKEYYGYGSEYAYDKDDWDKTYNHFGIH